MRILVIDDERTFHQGKVCHWNKINSTPLIVYARNYNQAFKNLMSNWDIVYLDHDLGEGVDGYGLCVEIEKLAYQGKLLNVGKFIIHSMNPIGRMNMFRVLCNFYNVEFARAEDLI